MPGPTNICVLGAGVVGLSTAYLLSETYRNNSSVSITIFADEFSPNVTTDTSGGFWEPYYLGDTPEHKIKKWGSDTFAYITQLATCDLARVVGAQFLSGYSVYNTKPEVPFWHNLVLGFRAMHEHERMVLFPSYKYGFFFTTLVLNPTKYLSFIRQQFLSNGGIIVKTKVDSMQEMTDRFDIVINCTGLGSLKLLQDTHLHPVRGQTVRVRAPWVKHFFFDADDGGYVLPGVDEVVMGGTHQMDNFNLKEDPQDTRDIWRKATKMCPSLQGAEVTRVMVGLRPWRTELRLESEFVAGKESKCLLIHNYGHGGSGMTLFWGCAKDVLSIVDRHIGRSSA